MTLILLRSRLCCQPTNTHLHARTSATLSEIFISSTDIHVVGQEDDAGGLSEVAGGDCLQVIVQHDGMWHYCSWKLGQGDA